MGREFTNILPPTVFHTFKINTRYQQSLPYGKLWYQFTMINITNENLQLKICTTFKLSTHIPKESKFLRVSEKLSTSESSGFTCNQTSYRFWLQQT